MRSKPQPLSLRDYVHVDAIIVVITTVVSCIVIITLWTLLHYFIKHRRRKLHRHSRRRTAIKLQHLRSMESDADSLRISPLRKHSESESLGVSLLDTHSNYSTLSNSVRDIRPLKQYNIPNSKQTAQEPLTADGYVRHSRRCVCCLSVLVCIFSIVVILTFPEKPSFNVCNSETDWNSIWLSLIHGSAQQNFDVLFTLKNRNYFSIQLTDVSARVYYQRAMIGYWYPEINANAHRKNDSYDIHIPSHSIVDVLAEMTFTPGIAELYDIYDDYEADELHLEIHFIANTRTYLLNNTLELDFFDMHINLDKQDFVVGATLPTDRSDCNCPKDE